MNLMLSGLLLLMLVASNLSSAGALAVALLDGGEPEINDTTTYDNGKLVVPSFLLGPVPVVADNVESALVDTGYWTAEELGL
jgi:putative multiple sugar transport system substrate-binding protein